MSVLFDDRAHDILGKLKVRLASDDPLLDKVNAVGNDWDFGTIEVRHHGPMSSFLFCQLLVGIWIVQWLENSRAAIHTFNLSLSKLRRASISLYDYFTLSKFEKQTILDVPNGVIQAHTVDGIWHISYLLRVAQSFM